MKPKRIEISYKTIVFTVVFLLALVVLWQIRALIILLFISFVFMEALNPAVNRLERFKIPRPLGILLLYIIILAVITFAVAGIVPIFVDQTAALIKSLPDLLQNVKIFGNNAIDFSSQFKILENIPANIAKTAVSVVTNIISGFIIFFLTFYLLLEKKNFPKYSLNLLGEKGKVKFLKIIDSLESRLGHWVNAEFFLMTIIGILSYLGYLVLGLKYAVPLAIFAGLLEAVPTLGPTLATIVAAIVGFTVSPLIGILTIAWGIIIQQLENNIIVPKIMKQTVGFNPLITILLIATGAKLAGIIGAVLAVPLYLTIETIVKVLSDKSIS
ncbi:MAG: AI-2E family transporter [Candidatus Shapirobacteria bacterium]|nr:AI-2E family transporter [Candidatus Shapirobacteria bacterium]